MVNCPPVVGRKLVGQDSNGVVLIHPFLTLLPGLARAYPFGSHLSHRIRKCK